MKQSSIGDICWSRGILIQALASKPGFKIPVAKLRAVSLFLGFYITVQEWLQRYRTGGLDQLLRHNKSSGRPRSLPEWAEKALEKRLQQPQGFESYGEICQWLETNLGVQAPYKTVHQLVHYRLNASPKVARPESTEQSQAQIEAFKKT